MLLLGLLLLLLLVVVVVIVVGSSLFQFLLFSNCVVSVVDVVFIPAFVSGGSRFVVPFRVLGIAVLVADVVNVVVVVVVRVVRGVRVVGGGDLFVVVDACGLVLASLPLSFLLFCC